MSLIRCFKMIRVPVSALLAWFPASWASKIAPCFIGEEGGSIQLPQEVAIVCPFERFPSFAKIQARDTATTARDTDTGHAASTAATAQAAGEVLTGASIRCGYEFRCCCKFCRKARAYEVEDASK